MKQWPEVSMREIIENSMPIVLPDLRALADAQRGCILSCYTTDDEGVVVSTWYSESARPALGANS